MKVTPGLTTPCGCEPTQTKDRDYGPLWSTQPTRLAALSNEGDHCDPRTPVDHSGMPSLLPTKPCWRGEKTLVCQKSQASVISVGGTAQVNVPVTDQNGGRGSLNVNGILMKEYNSLYLASFKHAEQKNNKYQNFR